MERRARFAASCTLVALSLALLAACGGGGSYVWYSSLPKSEWTQPNEYVMGVGDSLSIFVYEQPNLSGKVRIRRDGRISLPFVGELLVAGKHPSQLAKELETRLKAIIVTPRVTVNVEESQPVSISVLGEVGQRGTLTLQPPAELAQALAQAGGLSEFADDSRIFVLRRFPIFRRIRFTYDAIVQNQGGAATFPLQTGDVLVVE
jgi:polysaccharide export outer membrane protein